MTKATHEKELIRLVEPSFMTGVPSPFYKSDHLDFQSRLRKYLETEVVPYVDEWSAKKEYPYHLHKAFNKLGAQQAVFRVHPRFGGAPVGRYDSFHELIVWSELARVSLNSVTFMMGIDSMGVPPIISHGSDDLKSLILPEVVRGNMHVALAISESTAGSDVANISTSAVKTEDGRFYIINGSKKWISGANVCSFLTTCVRTQEGTGARGISVIAIPKGTPGISIR